MKSKIAHDIKHRDKPNDEFITPPKLVDTLLPYVPINRGDIICDNAYGTGVFFDAFKKYDATKYISYSTDFFDDDHVMDWFITNPPYSKMDRWLEDSCLKARKGFAYLLGYHNLTPRRIEMCEKNGFRITKIHLCKVFKWFGISAFVVWERYDDPQKVELTYDRVVWR